MASEILSGSLRVNLLSVCKLATSFDLQNHHQAISNHISVGILSGSAHVWNAKNVYTTKTCGIKNSIIYSKIGDKWFHYPSFLLRSILMLSSHLHLGCSSFPLPLGFSTKTLYAFLVCPMSETPQSAILFQVTIPQIYFLLPDQPNEHASYTVVYKR